MDIHRAIAVFNKLQVTHCDSDVGVFVINLQHDIRYRQGVALHCVRPDRKPIAAIDSQVFLPVRPDFGSGNISCGCACR